MSPKEEILRTKAATHRTEHIFKSSVGSFGLSIGLWMESGGHGKAGAHGTEETLPKPTGELGITVRDNGHGETMEAENVVEEDLRSVRSCGSGVSGD